MGSNLIDIRTVFVTYFALTVMCTVFVGYLWSFWRGTAPGIALWLSFYIVEGLAIVLIVARGLVPDFLSMAVANTMVVGGLMLLLVGLERFFGVQRRHVHDVVFLVVFAAVHTYFSIVQPNLMARDINAAVGLLWVASQAIWVLTRRVEPGFARDARPVTLVFFVYALLGVARIVAVPLTVRGQDFFGSGLAEGGIMLVYSLQVAALTIALVLMVSAHLQDELRADVKRRRSAEVELRNSQEKIAAAFNAMPEAVVVKRVSDGAVLEANGAFFEMTGYRRDTALGSTVAELGLWVDPAERTRLFAIIDDLGSAHDYEAAFRRADGSTFPGLVSCQRLTISEEPALMMVVRDVTVQKRRDAELARLQEGLERRVEERTEELRIASDAKSALLANMSHELRTPLNAVIGYSGILLQGMAGPLNDEQLKQLGMVNDAGKHLLALVSELLDLSRIEAGRMNVEFCEVSVTGVVGAVADLAAPMADAQGLALVTDVDPALRSIRSDGTRLEQALLNLVSNAIKFTPSGCVTLTARADGPDVVFEVADTGIGIDSAEQRRIFEPFYQGSSSQEAKIEGTGLGLALTRRITTALGGTIALASTPGRGSTFTLRFPREAVAA
jgi:PAS domain S-box-containing protein